MPRPPLSAIVFVILGAAAGLAGIAMAGWAATTHFKVERGFDAAMWAMARSPVPFQGEPIAIANAMIQDVPVMFLGAFGLFLCLVCYSFLRDARIALLPAGAPVAGMASLALSTRAPRAGQPMEGHVRLKKAAKAGEVFEVSVQCTRRIRDTSKLDRRDRTETLHYESIAVAAEKDAQGWVLPFQFELPVTAPASQGRQFYGYRWEVKHWSKKAWITTGSPLDVDVGPASHADMSAFQATLPPADEAEVDSLARDLERLRRPLRPHDRAELRALSPQKREEMRRMVAHTSKFDSGLQKVILVIVGSVFAIVALLFGIGWALSP